MVVRRVPSDDKVELESFPVPFYNQVVFVDFPYMILEFRVEGMSLLPEGGICPKDVRKTNDSQILRFFLDFLELT